VDLIPLLICFVLASVAFEYGWISDTKFQKFLEKDWIQICKSFWYGTGDEKCCRSGGHGPGVPELSPARFCFLPSEPDPEQNFLKNRTRVRSNFSISAVAGVRVVIS